MEDEKAKCDIEEAQIPGIQITTAGMTGPRPDYRVWDSGDRVGIG